MKKFEVFDLSLSLLLLLIIIPPKISFSQVTIEISAPGNEFGYAVAADDDGFSYIGGSAQNKGLVLKVDVAGEVVWSKQLNPNLNSNEILNVSYLQVVEDTLFGCGWISTGGIASKGTVYFKIDKNSGIPFWSRSEKISDSYYSTMKYYQGKYFLMSAKQTNNNVYDGKLVCVESNSGAILWSTNSWGVEFNNFGIDHVDDYYAMTEVQNDKFYVSGRSYVSGNNNNMRATIFGFDINGNMILKKYLLENESAPGIHRYYGMNISYDGADSLVIALLGTQNCSGSCDNFKAGIIKTDLNANISFAKFYDFTGSPREYVKMMNVTSDSYVLFGALNFTNSNNSLFALRTNKQGVFQNATEISIPATTLPITMAGINLGGSSAFKNNLHYFTASAHNGNANLRDVVLVQLDEFLETNNDCFNINNPLVTTINLVNTSFNFTDIPKSTSITSALDNTTLNYSYPSQCTDTSDLEYLLTPISCDSTYIEINSNSGTNYTVSWSNGDQGNSTVSENGIEAIVHLFNTDLCCHIYDTISTFPNYGSLQINLPNDTSICFLGNTDFEIIPILDCDSCDILWSNSSSDSSLVINQPGTYSLTVTNGCGSATDSITILDLPTTTLSNINSIDTCLATGTSIQVPIICSFCDSILLNGAQTTSPSITINSDTLITVIAIGSCNNDTTSLNAFVNYLPSFTNIGDTVVCNSDLPLNLQISPSYYDSIYWSNGQSGNSVSISDSGLYTVSVYSSCGVQIDSFHVTVEKQVILQNIADIDTCINLGDTLIVPIHNVGALSINSNGTLIPIDTIFIWNDSIFEIIGTNNCYADTITFFVDVDYFPAYIASTDIDTCSSNNLPIELSVQTSNADLAWYDGSTSNTLEVNSSGVYHFIVQNECASFYDSILVTLNTIPDLIADYDKVFCNDDTTFYLHAYSTNSEVSWLPHGELDSLLVDESGEYIVIAQNQCGSIYDTVDVFIGSIPAIELPDTLKPCKTQIERDFFSSFTSDLFELLDSYNNSVSNITSSGNYVLIVHNQCGSIEKDVYVNLDDYTTFYLPNTFTPDGNEFNNVYEIVGVGYSIESVRIYNRWGELILDKGADFENWDGTFHSMCQDGIYNVIINYLDCDNRVNQKSLFVNIIR